MSVENRRFFRYRVYPDVTTSIMSNSLTLMATLLDISLGGAYIADVNKDQLKEDSTIIFNLTRTIR